MKNTLKWKNRTTMPFTIKIYRGTSPLDRANLTNPIATLTNGETSYDDEVTRGSLNYYVIETIKGAEKVPSNNFSVLAMPKKGPGPVTLKQGDYNYGYFGSMPSRDLISGAQLLELFAPEIGWPFTPQLAPIWHKYIRKGKILYIPQGPITIGGFTYQTLYNKGLVFGVDGPGPYQPPGSSPTNQLKTVDVGGSKLKLRLMTGFDESLTGLATNVPSAVEYLNPAPNEWDDLVYPLCEVVPAAQRMANVAQLNSTGLKYSVNSTYIRCPVQEMTGTSPIFRATTGGTRAYAAGISTQSATTAFMQWWPVLELVEG